MRNAWRNPGAGAALIVLLTVLAYLPALDGGFIWDDDFYVTANQALRSVEGLGKIWTRPGMRHQQYYPLSFTGLWLEYHLWDLRPFGYHLVNILLHAANALLLWSVLRRLDVPGSWWAAAIFALHPVQVESVAWITEFKNVTSATFSLLALLAFLRFRPLPATGKNAGGDGRFHALAILLFVCGLLCKTAVCCLPVVLAVLMWWKLERFTWRDVGMLVPWFGASLALGLITVRAEWWMPEGEPAGLALSMAQRVVLAGRALWFYAGKLFWPYPLAFVYPRWNLEASTLWSDPFPLTALAVVAALWLLRRRIGKGPLAGAACFAVMLAPVLGFFDIYYFQFSYVADHFQYLGCVGLIALAVGAGATLADRAGRRGRELGCLAAAVVLLGLGGSTWRRTHVYRDRETLWRDTLAKNPSTWLAHNNLGIELQDSGRTREAIEHFEQALRLKPDCVNAHYNLANALWQTGRRREAMGHWEEALRIAPRYAEAHNNFGNALLEQGRTAEAIAQYEQVLALNPEHAGAHNNLGNALLAAGRPVEAIAQYEAALRAGLDTADVHYNLGIALEQAGRTQQALAQYGEALRIAPDFAPARNGIARLRTGLRERDLNGGSSPR
jgi:tetratricopeptide (TPR) repeat protein